MGATMSTPQATEITLTTADKTNAFVAPAVGITRNHGMSDEEKIKAAREDGTTRLDGAAALSRDLPFLQLNDDEEFSARTLNEERSSDGEIIIVVLAIIIAVLAVLCQSGQLVIRHTRDYPLSLLFALCSFQV